MNRATVLAGIAALASAPADAGPPAPRWQGIWTGTIDSAPVHMCLESKTYGNRGLYFYDRHGTMIGLDAAPGAVEQTDGTTLWSEAAPDSEAATRPALALGPPAGDVLTGSWKKNAAAASVPVTLTRVGAKINEYESPCANYEFVAPLVREPVVRRRPAVFEGVPIVAVTVDTGRAFDVSIESFNLGGTSAGTQRINVALNAELPKRAKGSDYLECILGGLGSVGGGDYAKGTKPTMITAHWMATETDVSYSCGGAHPDNDTIYALWDRQTGRKVDIDGWFSRAAFSIESGKGYRLSRITPALRARLVALWKGEGECADSIGGADYWSIAVDRRGISFIPQLSHAEAPCEEPILLSYRAVGRWLSRAGRAGVASVEQDVGLARR